MDKTTEFAILQYVLDQKPSSYLAGIEQISAHAHADFWSLYHRGLVRFSQVSQTYQLTDEGKRRFYELNDQLPDSSAPDQLDQQGHELSPQPKSKPNRKHIRNALRKLGNCIKKHAKHLVSAFCAGIVAALATLLVENHQLLEEFIKRILSFFH